MLNIVQRLKNRFDPFIHKAKNDELIKKMKRKKAANEAKFDAYH